jgi:hypothetical protein
MQQAKAIGLMLKFVGYSAAGALTMVSVTANARFGWTLGASPLDKAAYVATSVAIDAFKVGLPLLAMPLWVNRHRTLAVCAITLWVGCTTWSANAALGFLASTRGEVVAQRIADAKARTGWETTVERAEQEVARLAHHRPAAVVRADLNAAAVVGSVWQRSVDLRRGFALALPEPRLPWGYIIGSLDLVQECRWCIRLRRGDHGRFRPAKEPQHPQLAWAFVP